MVVSHRRFSINPQAHAAQWESDKCFSPESRDFSAQSPPAIAGEHLSAVTSHGVNTPVLPRFGHALMYHIGIAKFFRRQPRAVPSTSFVALPLGARGCRWVASDEGQGGGLPRSWRGY